ncbi:Vesicle transport protein, Got1/SFT2-like [Cinara cedri]|uniref:Vesicle transport protein n=1 Tax=Cinara cedri TaxID=506608 RepID=A0A5E4N4M3_9HEMI|nr:Vesicle transport protein, Got1/SFT2-like [Cinara cedri]
MEKLRKVLSGQDNRDNDSSTGILPNVNQMSSLEWSTRIKGFIACFVIGIFFSLMGATALILPLPRRMAVFGIFYTLGNITSLLSTCFLMGPLKQIKKMFSSSRIIATIVALAMIVLTLVAAIGMKNAPLTFLCIIFQFLALTWYSLSYIPYARDAIKSSMSTIIA